MFALLRSSPVATTVLARRAIPSLRLLSTSSPPESLSEGEKTIYAKLQEKFSPSELQVADVSGGCGSFYAISITSGAFKGLPMIKQHRLVNDTLKEEIQGIHGLQLKTIAV